MMRIPPKVKFLGIALKTKTPEQIEIEGRYKGGVFLVDRLPEGFELVPTMFGLPILSYKGAVCFREFVEEEKPTIQPTITGEAALLARRVKKEEPIDKIKAKKIYKEPEPYQLQLDKTYQTTLLVLGGIGAFIALLKLSKSR